MVPAGTPSNRLLPFTNALPGPPEDPNKKVEGQRWYTSSSRFNAVFGEATLWTGPYSAVLWPESYHEDGDLGDLRTQPVVTATGNQQYGGAYGGTPESCYMDCTRR